MHVFNVNARLDILHHASKHEVRNAAFQMELSNKENC